MGDAADITLRVYEAQNALLWVRIKLNELDVLGQYRYLNDLAYQAQLTLTAIALGHARKAALGAEVDS